MPTTNRFVVPGCAHHVCQRGVRKEPTFHDDSDYLVYLRVLQESCTDFSVEIRAYCLMTNHVHLVAVPESETSISRALHRVHTRYAQYFNTKYMFVGHLWQRRPGMCPMDEVHMWAAIRYVERNPVRAHMVKRAEDYLWSSAAAHCGLRDDTLLSQPFPDQEVIRNWSEWLQIEPEMEQAKALRTHTKTGRPWARPEFLAHLESLTGRTLCRQKSGPRSPRGQSR